MFLYKLYVHLNTVATNGDYKFANTNIRDNSQESFVSKHGTTTTKQEKCYFITQF